MAKADKLGMRHSGRPTVRPVYPRNETSPSFGVGDAVDVWWSDGWWEGVIFDTSDGENGIYQIYIPGLYLIVVYKFSVSVSVSVVCVCSIFLLLWKIYTRVFLWNP